ncbi:MAG: iron ABC transporter permease [Acidimicrobiia bacterium]|nr:iron ABC transporter permease [Acidimicrobiia bacterium]
MSIDIGAGPLDTDAPLPSRPRRRPAPRLLYVLGVLAVAPAAIPLVELMVRVVGSPGTVADTLGSGRTWELVWRTVWFTTVVTFSAAILGVTTAWATTRTDLRGSRVWSVLVSLPLAIPSYVMVLVLLSLFGPRGLIAEATEWTVPSASGFWPAWAALTLATYPYVHLVVSASMRRLSKSLEDAARGLGASPMRVFFTITVPQLRPAIAAGALLSALYTVSDFGAVSLARFDVFTRAIYTQYQGRIDRTPAAVLAMVLILLALVVVWGEQRSRGRAAYHTRSSGTPPRPDHLGRGARTGVYALLSVVGLVGVVLPIVVLMSWVARSDIGIPWGSLAGSVSASALAAALAAVLALPAVITGVRHPGTASTWLERITYLVFAIPHITVGLAVVVFAANRLGPLYQSLALMVVVYASLFLAEAVGAGRAALLRVDPHLEEAARGLGRSPVRAFIEVTLPLIRRGIGVGAVLVFLSTLKELPVTLLLRPTGFDTLAVDVWSATDQLRYGQAAVPALLLIAVSVVPIYLLVIRRRMQPL